MRFIFSDVYVPPGSHPKSFWILLRALCRQSEEECARVGRTPVSFNWRPRDAPGEFIVWTETRP